MTGPKEAFLRIALRTAKLLPAGLSRLLGRGIGLSWFHFVRIRRGLVEENLSQAYGLDRRNPTVRALARRNFAHYGQLVLEVMRLRLYIDGRDPDLVTFEGLEHLDAAREEGKGVLVLTAHLGNYDLMAVAVALEGYPVTIVSKPLRDKKVEKIWMGEREASGLRILLHRNTLREILRALKDNGLVGFVLDQHARKDSVRVDFFGRPASTLRSLALMANRTGAPVIPIFSRRLDDGTHVVKVHPQIEWEPRDDADEALALNTQRYTKVIEDAVREVPEQWTWIHRRWKE